MSLWYLACPRIGVCNSISFGPILTHHTNRVGHWNMPEGGIIKWLLFIKRKEIDKKHVFQVTVQECKISMILIYWGSKHFVKFLEVPEVRLENGQI